jgi:peptidoglycan/LPS O-acetylase OafA/YrhL
MPGKLAFQSQDVRRQPAGQNAAGLSTIEGGYRPDIDGLRAVAVIAVLLFHGRFGVPGGFVGVDVFFVISGFLITSILLRGSGNGSMSLATFWERRIRRIFPAQLLVVVVTLVLGWFVLLPADFRDLAASAAAQALFMGNFWFWKTTGYFDAGALTKPLLHMWSLAVEEQFYLIFPLLLWPLRSWSRPGLRVLFLVLAGISFAVGLVLTWRAPAAAYFLLPGRAWELLLGAALSASPPPIRVPPVLRSGLATAGLLAVVASFFLLSERTPFPGFAALLPCLGTAVLIWANGLPGSVSFRLLSLPPLKFVGRISYSLYLWHWPVLIFAEYWQPNPLRWPWRATALAFCGVMAWISYIFVETPFRTRKLLPARRNVLAFGLMTPAVIVAIAIPAIVSSGFPERFPPIVRSLAEGRSDFPFTYNLGLDRVLNGELPTLGSRKASDPVGLLIWGDSHAMALLPALDQIGRDRQQKIAIATHFATPPIQGMRGADKLGMGDESDAWNEAVFSHVARLRVPHVLLACRWTLYQLGRGQEKSAAICISDAVSRLQASGVTVWLVKEVPIQPVHIPKTLALAALHGENRDVGVSVSTHHQRSSEEDLLLAAAVKVGARLLDPGDVLPVDSGRFKVEVNGRCLYTDANHLSSRGAALLRPMLDQIWSTR